MNQPIAGINPIGVMPAPRPWLPGLSTTEAGQGSYMIFVLVVEDEESISDPLSYMLRKELLQGRRLPDRPRCAGRHSTSTGADLVPLDLVLPGAAGTEVCCCLRETVGCAGDHADRQGHRGRPGVGLGLGADDYVTKPFSWRDLLTRIQAVLRRSPRFPRRWIRHGPCYA